MNVKDSEAAWNNMESRCRKKNIHYPQRAEENKKNRRPSRLLTSREETAMMFVGCYLSARVERGACEKESGDPKRIQKLPSCFVGKENKKKGQESKSKAAT